ncbi:MAG: DegT/DnrJ/EryC1/StrS family aminotransferase, partial [Bacteroidetes bacterium]|nr:DegT/DnrJ/EryC1/StrS family aminotransferase [Bacteroidota bacterium]
HGIYYPIPLHKQKAYADERYKEDDFAVTNRISEEVLSLPMHTELTVEQIAFISSTIVSFLNEHA